MFSQYNQFVSQFSYTNYCPLKIIQNEENVFCDKISLLFLVLVLVAFVKEVQLTKVATCDPNESRVCLLAYTISMAPSSCCDVVKQHRSCYCQYKNNPKFQSYLQFLLPKGSSRNVELPSPLVRFTVIQFHYFQSEMRITKKL